MLLHPPGTPRNALTMRLARYVDLTGHERDALAALQAAHPEVPVILSAGLDPTEVVACCAEQPPAAILHKPFRPAQLTALLARLLQRNSTRNA